MAIYGNMVVPSRPGGGALPTNGETPAVYVPGSTVNARFSDAGAQIAGQAAQQSAKSLGDVARGVGRLAPMFGAFAERADRLDMAKAQEAVSRLQIEGIEERTRLSRLKGAAAVGADGKALDVEEQWRNWYTQARAKHAEGLGERGRRYFELHADNYNVQQQAWAAQYAEQQLGRFQDQQLAFAVDAEASVIGQDPTNAQAVTASLGRINALIDQKAARMGWTPDMAAQAKQAAAGQAMGNAMLQQMQLGRPEVAYALFGQYGHLLNQQQYVQVFQAYQQALLVQGRIAMQGNDWRALGQLGGQSSKGLDMYIEAATSRKAGTPYAYGTKRDCSGHTSEMWQGAPINPAKREEIFGKPGAHVTSEELIDRAAKATGHLYQGAEINPQTVGGGWIIGVSHGKPTPGRPRGMTHVVSTFVNSQGVLMVSESSRGRGIHSETFADWFKRYDGKGDYYLYGANLTSLMGGGAPQAMPGAPAGGTPAGWQEWTGERGKTIPERQHNPGAVKPPKGYSTFRSDAEGFLAQAKALRDDKYYANKTIKDLVLTYVGYNPPPSYWQKVQEQGFRLDEVPDRSDNRVLARLMVGLARGESPLGKHYEPEQVEALLNGGQGAGPMKGGAPGQPGMPMMQGAPGMGRGLYASPETVAQLGQMQGEARARSMGQWYNAEIEAGRMTYGEAMQQAQQIQDDKLRAGVKTELSQNETIRQTLEKEAFDKATMELGTTIDQIQQKMDSGDRVGALKELFDLAKAAQADSIAHPGDKNLKRKLKVYQDAYKALSDGGSLSTDPEAWHTLSEDINEGRITSEAQLAKNPAYVTMAAKDKNELKSRLKNLQKVDRQYLRAQFDETFGSPDEVGLDKEESKKRKAMWKMIQQDVDRVAKETNLGQNKEWLEERVKLFASKAVRPGRIWDTESTYADERIGDATGDYLPKATPAELAVAGSVLSDMPSDGVKAYMEQAARWKDRNGSFAKDSVIAEYLFLRSQKEAKARGDRPPARPAGVPENAEWLAHERFGYGWRWKKGGKTMFEPYIYVARRGEE